MGEKSKYCHGSGRIGRQLFALTLILGVTAGTLSWWLGFVWFYLKWPKPQFASFTQLISQVVELSNPDAEHGFFEAYSLLLRNITRIALYRISQSTLASLPLVAGLLLAWVLDHSWTFIASSTITTLVFGIRTLSHRPDNTDHHALDSQ